MSLKLNDLQVGDVIRTTRTHKVRKVDPLYVGIMDVNNGQTFGIARDADHGTLSVEVVKKAAPKPKVGDVLTFSRVVNTKWKRGTVLTDGEGFVYLLSARGYWVSPNTDSDSDTHCDFLDLDPYSAFTVVHLP